MKKDKERSKRNERAKELGVGGWTGEKRSVRGKGIKGQMG